MAKGDSPSGLLSKVAKFVRNPTKDWSELDLHEPQPDSGYSKESLKEMIERKRQNDFVRKREFDHLRKLRRREPLSSTDQTGRASLFLSSIPSNLDDRAETLKKIDEIEAQMSRQWWKGRQEESVAPAAGSASASQAAPRPPADARPQADDSLFAQTEASALGLNSDWDASSAEFSPTQMGQAVTVPGPMHLQDSLPLPASSRAAATTPAPGETISMGAGFASSKLFAVELTDSLTDPDLEEAAIRFANGDDAGAETGLLHALQGDNLRPELAEAWMAALFDLYRATGQQARFDSVALDFANRFGRSAPAWFSTPDLLGHKNSESVGTGGMHQALAQEPIWTCPAELTAEALAQLQAVLPNSAAPWQLDWSALVTIAPDAVDALTQLFGAWCATPVQLVFRGYESFHGALRALTPSGDKGVSPKCWQLRMDALRVMHLQDEFELVALEYCVTFEVSPPSWQEVRCTCHLDGAGPVGGVTVEDFKLSERSVWSDSAQGQEATADAVRVELAGEIVGDATDALRRLEAGLDGGNRLVISCAHLIRVDFSAAGSILNWVIAQETQGCQVQFREVNRIVAAFFNVIGINEHAWVVPRST